ncbi:MAG: benzoate-CoA ligase family protein [Gammaproteobacteria bacterium]|nr:benzoate-CoA ligase family protein [Gammaproteobacteria bacterium]
MGLERHYNAAVDFLDRHVADGLGDKLAVVDPDRALTYRELLESAARVGGLLGSLGVDRESRVACVLLDTVDFPVVFWGAVRAGIVPVLLNTRLTVEQYRYLLEDSRARVAFVSAPLVPLIAEAARGLDSLRAIIVVDSSADRDACDDPDDRDDRDRRFGAMLARAVPVGAASTDADEVAFWLYSSGTTGPPKGVMHVHSTPRTVAQLCGRGLIGCRSDDVCFSAAKMFFAYGLGNSMFVPLGAGATTILCPDHPTTAAIGATLRRFHPTLFFGVPTLYGQLIEEPAASLADGVNRLRSCFSAGEPLPAPLGQAWQDRFGVEIVDGVGSTEIAYLFLSNVPGRVEYGTSGVPIEGFDLRLVDDEGRDVAAGVIGELLVRAPTAAQGYWNHRDKSRRTFQGEWVRTGDKYERRADGVYLYHGRTDDMFKVSGIWVSPLEIEAALLTHPAVLEAAVIAFEARDGLLKPKAFVVLKAEAYHPPGRALYEELKVHVKRAIGPWKYPRWIEFVDDLPRTATGKLQRYKLR